MTDQKKKRLRRTGARLGIAGIALAATLGIAACGGSSEGEEINRALLASEMTVQMTQPSAGCRSES